MLLALMLSAALAARAAVTIGPRATRPSAFTPDLCVPGTYVQTATGAAPRYEVPGDGVITSWQTFVANLGSGRSRLKVVRQSITDPAVFRIMGASDYVDGLVYGIRSSSTRIAVHTGDLIGIGTTALRPGERVVPCIWRELAVVGDVVRSRMTSGADEAPALTTDLAWDIPTLLSDRVNVSATIESDVDGDSFGDETQDQCLGTAGPVDGCPTPTTTTTLPACATFVDCEPILSAALPVAATVGRKAKGTARQLGALERMAARSYHRAEKGNERVRMRHLTDAKRTLAHLLAKAQAADGRGRLDVPLAPIEAAVAQLVTVF